MEKRDSGVLTFLSLLIAATLFPISPAYSAWVWSPESGRFVNPDAAVQETPQEQYDYALEFYKNKDLKEATSQLRLLLKRFPGARVAPEAQYRLGVIYEETGDYYKAFRAYRDLLERYPQSERVAEAVEREFRIGNLFLSGRRAKVMGLAILPSGPRAIEVFKHIAEAAPYSEYGDKAQFHLGLAYKKTNHFEEALQAFQTLIDQHPASKLVPQARFQIADSSYLQSVIATRDQHVMDRASKEIDKFLSHYPDSSVSDKAARLRQEIDEKNAEKNYRIGLFYEKENFLDSAFIYYRDVSDRYPHTQWGKKAMERLKALEKPADYLKAQEAEVVSKKEGLLKELQAVGETDLARRKEIEWELERVEKQEKEVQKSKPEMMKRRQAALHQKEKDLAEKWKALKKKKKRFSKNPSEDLVLAFERWEASLEKEQNELFQEKLQIKEWGRSLGVRTKPLLAELIPFRKEALSPLEQVQQVEAERFVEIGQEKAKLLGEKEDLYREYEKLLVAQGLGGSQDPAFEAERAKLDREIQEIKGLEEKLQEKENLYKKHFGVPSWQAVWRVPTRVIGRSVDVLNPFEGSPRKGWEAKSAEELRDLKERWQAKIAQQKALVDVIAHAFDSELARAEEERLTQKVEEEGVDATTLRRTIKQLERQIRSHYNEIQDRNDRKNELLEELDRAIHHRDETGMGPMGQTGKVLSAPARGFYSFWKAFLFGLPERDVTLTREAGRVSLETDKADLIGELKEQIELESLLIDARNTEIERLKREVEGLRARTSLDSKLDFRSLLVKFPYVFVREAIVSANRLIPKKARNDELIEQLNRETEKLERLKSDLGEIEILLAKKGKRRLRSESTPSAPAPRISEPATTGIRPDQSALRDEIQSLQKQLAVRVSTYEHEREGFEKIRWDKLSKERGKGRTEKLRELEEDLVRLIQTEQKLSEEEQELLSKKREVVQQFLEGLPPDLFTKELTLEREQINSRLNELQKRKTTLGEEVKRFRPQALPSS